MATLTNPHTTSGAQPKAVHAGANSITGYYSLTGNLSAGDVIQMVKIPAGAVVTDMVLLQITGAGSAHQIAVGDGLSTARYLALTSVSGSVVYRATAGIPYSYSADDTIDVLVNAVTSATTVGSFALTVMYKMDDPIAG